MKYKVLILDLDGTTIPNTRNGLPSKRVQIAVQSIARHMYVCIATGRPLGLAHAVLESLVLNSPCILNNGTLLYDPIQKKILRQFLLPLDAIAGIYTVTQKNGIQLFLNTVEKMDIAYRGQEVSGSVLSMFSAELDPEVADQVKEEVEKLGGLMVHKIHSWKKDKIDIEISNINASKQHGVIEISKILRVQPDEIIGVGDSYNDFPLLMACGLKIAMRNAAQELMDIADFIAPSVDDDGVAIIIEKLLLKSI